MADKILIKKHFVEEKIEGGTTLFDVETSTFYSFNESGSLIFGLLKKGKPVDYIASSLVKKYSISEKKAKKDVDDFIDELLKNKIASFSGKKGQNK